MVEEDDVRTLWVDTDSHGNGWGPIKNAVFESYTTTVSTWDLDAPPTALDFCRYTSREYGDVRSFFFFSSSVSISWIVGHFGARMSKNPNRDFCVFQRIDSGGCPWMMGAAGSPWVRSTSRPRGT